MELPKIEDLSDVEYLRLTAKLYGNESETKVKDHYHRLKTIAKRLEDLENHYTLGGLRP